MHVGRVVAALGLVVGLGAVGLQFSLSIPLRIANGDSLAGALVYFFTFYTILTNLMLVLVYLSALVGWRWLGWWRSPVTRGMMAGAIVLVMGFYHLILAGLWAPQGWFRVADVALHYVTPILYVLWWLLYEPKGRLRMGDSLPMLLPSLVWLAWAMLRGAVTGQYPYPILEADRLGYETVGLNILMVLAVLLLLFAAVVAYDRVAGRRRGIPPA